MYDGFSAGSWMFERLRGKMIRSTTHQRAWIDHSTGPVDYEVPQEWGKHSTTTLDMDTTTYSVDDFSPEHFFIRIYLPMSSTSTPI